jgi:hypothetical protein
VSVWVEKGEDLNEPWENIGRGDLSDVEYSYVKLVGMSTKGTKVEYDYGDTRVR